MNMLMLYHRNTEIDTETLLNTNAAARDTIADTEVQQGLGSFSDPVSTTGQKSDG